jgi:hypothetical protein
MHSRALAADPMRLIGERVDAGGVDPPIVEIEQRAHSDGEVQLLIAPSTLANVVQVGVDDGRRLVIYLVYEPEQRLVSFVETRRFDIPKHVMDEFVITKQFRRNCGVRLESKRAVVLL